MPNKVSYEHGARKLMAQDGPDPNDEFRKKPQRIESPRSA